MSQFQTLLRSRDSPLNIQTLILVVIIDATIPMPELANGYVDSIPCTNKTLKILLFKMYVLFLKITICLWMILILHSNHTSLLLEIVTTKFAYSKSSNWKNIFFENHFFEGLGTFSPTAKPVFEPYIFFSKK